MSLVLTCVAVLTSTSIAQDTLFYDDKFEDSWTWAGTYDQSFINSNACPVGSICVYLAGDASGSTLTHSFDSIDTYYNIHIGYSLTVSQLTDNSKYCYVQYKYGSDTYQPVAQYNSPSTNYKYPDQIANFPNATSSQLTVQFYLDALSGQQKCYLNNFRLYGSTTATPLPITVISGSPNGQLLFADDMRAEATLDTDWIWLGDYNKQFSNSNACPSGQYCILLSGVNGGTTLTNSFSGRWMDGWIDRYYNIYISYGITVSNIQQSNKYCYVRYKYGSDAFNVVARYTSTAINTKYVNQFTYLPNATSAHITIQFYIDATQNAARCYMNDFLLWGTKITTDSPTKQPTNNPSVSPSKYPSVSPSKTPTNDPSLSPSKYPSVSPSKYSSVSPSKTPTNNPSVLLVTAPPGVDVECATNDDCEYKGDDFFCELSQGFCYYSECDRDLDCNSYGTRSQCVTLTKKETGGEPYTVGVCNINTDSVERMSNIFGIVALVLIVVINN